MQNDELLQTKLLEEKSRLAALLSKEGLSRVLTAQDFIDKEKNSIEADVLLRKLLVMGKIIETEKDIKIKLTEDFIVNTTTILNLLALSKQLTSDVLSRLAPCKDILSDCFKIMLSTLRGNDNRTKWYEQALSKDTGLYQLFSYQRTMYGHYISAFFNKTRTIDSLANMRNKLVPSHSFWQQYE